MATILILQQRGLDSWRQNPDSSNGTRPVPAKISEVACGATVHAVQSWGHVPIDLSCEDSPITRQIFNTTCHSGQVIENKMPFWLALGKHKPLL